MIRLDLEAILLTVAPRYHKRARALWANCVHVGERVQLDGEQWTPALALAVARVDGRSSSLGALGWLESRAMVPRALAHTNQRGVSLVGVNLRGVDLRRATLELADLTGAKLARADMLGANLAHACLAGADMRRADLRGADLSHADLSGADLSFADLSGASLRCAFLGCEGDVRRVS